LLLRHDKRRVRSYRALQPLYRQTGHPEKSRACADALDVLARRELIVLSSLDGACLIAHAIEPHTPPSPPPPAARQPLAAEQWRRLQHPDEDRFLSVLFAQVAPLLAAALGRPQRQFGL